MAGANVVLTVTVRSQKRTIEFVVAREARRAREVAATLARLDDLGEASPPSGSGWIVIPIREDAE